VLPKIERGALYLQYRFVTYSGKPNREKKEGARLWTSMQPLCLKYCVRGSRKSHIGCLRRLYLQTIGCATIPVQGAISQSGENAGLWTATNLSAMRVELICRIVEDHNSLYQEFPPIRMLKKQRCYANARRAAAGEPALALRCGGINRLSSKHSSPR
jgi:hypothetical protein